eukprot:766992-Hanusia_phi.AAC.2
MEEGRKEERYQPRGRRGEYVFPLPLFSRFRFPAVSVRCKNSFGHLQSGELQELRKEIALAIFRRFGWSPVIKRSDSSLELQIVFNRDCQHPTSVKVFTKGSKLALAGPEHNVCHQQHARTIGRKQMR